MVKPSSFFFFSSRRRHTRLQGDWSSDVCSSDLFAPVPEERPPYVGLGTTLMAPVALGAPLAAGLLADAFGFATVFALAAAAGTVALALLVSLVRDPRGVRSGLTGRGLTG